MQLPRLCFTASFSPSCQSVQLVTAIRDAVVRRLGKCQTLATLACNGPYMHLEDAPIPEYAALQWQSRSENF